jgi:hypothetical protein
MSSTQSVHKGRQEGACLLVCTKNLFIEYQSLVKNIDAEKVPVRPLPAAGNIVYSRMNETAA